MNTVDLSNYSIGSYKSGSAIIRIFWYIVNVLFFTSQVPFPSSLKGLLLRLFGAKIGRGFLVKPRTYIKYPWFLVLGDHAWIGEHCWIDNVAPLVIGNNVCISQDVYICTGNHDYNSAVFALRLGPVVIEDGVWVGARATIGPHVTLKSHCVIAAGSVVLKETEPYGVYRGNPAVRVHTRQIKD